MGDVGAAALVLSKVAPRPVRVGAGVGETATGDRHSRRHGDADNPRRVPLAQPGPGLSVAPPGGAT